MINGINGGRYSWIKTKLSSKNNVQTNMWTIGTTVNNKNWWEIPKSEETAVKTTKWYFYAYIHPTYTYTPWLLTHPVPIPTGYIHPYFEAFIAFIKTTRSKNNIKGKPSKQTPKYKILQQPAEQRLLSRKPVWTLAEHSPVRPIELWRAQWEDHVMQRTSSLIWTRVDPCKAVLHQ